MPYGFDRPNLHFEAYEDKQAAILTEAKLKASRSANPLAQSVGRPVSVVKPSRTFTELGSPAQLRAQLDRGPNTP